MAISRTQADGSTMTGTPTGTDSGSWAESLRQAQPIEELFTRFEHYTALAQLALEDLQNQLAAVQAVAAPALVEADLPGNVVPFRPSW